MATFKFQPKAVPATEKDLQFINLLPEYLQTRENTKFFGTTIQQLFNIEQSETLSGYVGRKPGSYYTFAKDNYVKELTPDRQNYQLEPTMVSEDSVGDIYSTFFYNDLIDKLASQGGLTNNHDRLFKQEYYSFAPLMDLDKFSNYSNYYWSATGSTTLVQEETFTNLNVTPVSNSINIPGYGYKNGTIVKFVIPPAVTPTVAPAPLVNGESYTIVGIDDNNFSLLGVTLTTAGFGTFAIQPQTDAASIIGQQFASLPDGTALSNGMRIEFINDSLIDNNGVAFIVEGVGSSIQLIKDDAFTVQTDISQSIPDYITIQRGSSDGNSWSIRNRWFHKDLLKNIDQSSSTLVQAHRPIIEFFRNMQLYNYGNSARANVDLVYSSGNIQSLTGLPVGTNVDGIEVKDNYRILVINDQDSERTNRIFTVYGLGNSNAISLAIQTDGQNAFGQPVAGETVHVNSGLKYGGKTYYYNGTTWIEAQEKTSYNQAPLYYLYDDKGVKLDDAIEYPSSSFTGSTMFQYETSPLASKDPILGLNIVVDSFGAAEFSNTLENQTYTYLSNFVTTNISGYYFAYSFGLKEYRNHWHKAPFDSKQHILDQFTIGVQQNIAPSVTVKAATSGINIPGFISGGHAGTGIGDQIFNVNLVSGIIDGVTSWHIGDQLLLTNQYNASQNGIYEYVGGTTTYATLIRPASFDTTSEIIYDMAVAVQQGTVNANKSFIMTQTETLDWSLIPMLWAVQTTAYGLQRVYDLSQSPKSVAKYAIETVSINNVVNLLHVDIPNTFDNTTSYYYGSRILLKDQTNPAQNGVYVYTSGMPNDATLTLQPTYSVGDTFIVTGGTYLNYMYELQAGNVFVKVPKLEDNIQVQLNGAALVNYRDFEIVTGNVLILSLTLPINQNDLLQVWTYSTTGPIANYKGFYEIPLNLESNANNDFVNITRFDDLLPHFATVISNQDDFSGSELGANNYRDSSQNLGLGTGILQHSAPMLKLMMVNSLASTDIMTSMQYVEHEYVRFYNKFLNMINVLKTQGYTDTTSYQDWVITALNQINVGKNATFPFASNNVGSGNYYIPPSPAFLGITPIYRPQKFIDRTANTPLRVIRMHDGQLKPAYDNPITSPDINSNQTVVTIAGVDTYTIGQPLNHNLVFSWELIVEANNSPLIPEVDYTVSTGSTLPFLVLLKPLPAGTNIFVEWSNNILDEVILYLETMIFDSISATFKQNETVLTDGNVYYSPLQERPGYFRTTDFSRAEWNEIAQLDFNRWVSTNKVSADTIKIYNELNPFTWNYSNVLDPHGNNLPGYWRGIYKYFYDTDRPHTNPWEMFGFSEKPFWWNDVYGPAPYTKSNFTLWNDVQNGTIQQGSRAGTYSFLARLGITNYIPVDDNGNLLDPITIGLATSTPLTPISSSVISDYKLYANAPFVFGDLGPLEYAWQSSPNGSFGLAETMYLVKPPKFVEYFWETNNFVRIFPTQSENQLIIADSVADIEIRPPNSQAVIYTENSADLIIGIQQNIVDFLISTGQTASFLGARIRGANAHLAYRASGFIDAQNMTASVDSFGDASVNNTTLNILPANSLIIPEDNLTADSLIIPSDDIRVTLQVSPAIQEITYSALLFTNNSGYYELSGYDLSNQYFLYYKPITTSQSMTVNVGGKQPTLVPWAPGILYTINTYVTNGNLIYKAITQNISGTNFPGDSKYWVVVQTVPLIGGINVLQYSKYESTPTLLPYNTRFFTPQDIANFMYGYQNYLQTQGWQFETINADGSVSDFSYMLKQVLSWIIANNPAQNIIVVSPLSTLATFTSVLGYVDNLQNNISGMPTVVDRLGFAIPLDKLAVTRFDNTFTVQTLPSNVDQQIYGLKLNVVVIEHIVVFNDTTDFNDLIYSPLLDVRQERIYISVTRALNWNGQLSAPGFLVQANGISANFDKSVNDFTKFYDPNTAITASNIGLAAKAMFGFQKSQALTNVLMNEQDQFKFYQGFLKEKGTSPSFSTLLRTSYISDLNTVDFYEEWLVRLGLYGAIEAESIIEVGLVQDDIRSNPQIVEFTTTDYQDPTSNIIQIGPDDPRYLYKNFKNLTVDQFELSYISPSLPSAGYAMLTDATLRVANYSDLPAAINAYLATNTFTNGQRIWTAIGSDGYNWTMQRIDTAANLLTITQPITSGPVIITTDTPLLEGELVIIQGAVTASNNGVYVATNVTNTPLVGTISNPISVAGNLIINGITVSLQAGQSVLEETLTLQDITYTAVTNVIPENITIEYTTGAVAGSEIVTVVGNAISVQIQSGVSTALDIANAIIASVPASALVTVIANTPAGLETAPVLPTVLHSIMGAINAKSISNIIASNVSGILTITNSAGTPITISGDAPLLTALGLTAETFATSSFELFDINGNSITTATAETEISAKVLILHNVRFASSSSSITGTIQNPVLTAPLSFNLNGYTVSLNTGDSMYNINPLQNIVEEINALAIPNITAINFFGKLQILNSAEVGVEVLPRYIPELGLESTYPISGYSANDLLFFDNYQNTGRWAVTNTAPETISFFHRAFTDTAVIGQTGTLIINGVHIPVNSSDTLIQLAGHISSTMGPYLRGSIVYGDYVNEDYPNGGYVYASYATRYTPVITGQNFFNPLLALGVSGIVSINEKFIVVTSVDTLTSIAAKINAAAIFNVTASVIGTTPNAHLQITGLLGNDIIIHGNSASSVLNALGISYSFYDIALVNIHGLSITIGTGSTPAVLSALGLTTGTINSTLTVVREQQPQVDINYIKFVALMDGLTDIKLLDLNLYNPYQNVLPRNVVQEIDFMLDEDPAKYNDGSNKAVQQAGLAWVNEQVGRTWWDLSQVRYLDYDQGDLLYRYNNWGAIFPGTSVAIYEWTSSPVTPDNWTAYVTTGDGQNLYSATSMPKYIDRYVTDYVYDPAMGATVPVYYFWLGNNNLIPQVDFRNMDIVSMELIITNPTLQGVTWFSPIDVDTCLVSGVEELLTDTTLLQIAFNDYQTKNKRHTHWTLVRENETINPPPSEVWQKMKDSLVTFVKITDTIPNLENNGISSEMFATLQSEGNVTQQIATTPTYSVYLPVPDKNLLARQAYGNLFRPRQSWFNIPMSAREKFVQIANNLMNQTNWIDTNESWNANISIQAQLLETPAYTVGTLAEMYALLSTPNFNSGSTIYVLSDVTHNGNWSFWRYDSSSSAKFVLLQVQIYNTNLFWKRVDWYATGYNNSIITGQNVLVFPTLSDRNAYTGKFSLGQIVYITDNGDGTWASYTYDGIVGPITEWTLIAHQEATVNFLENLYDFSTVSATDLAFTEHAASEAMIHIIDGFYQNLSTVKNKNQMTVGMIREAYRQNISVDWAFKSSYISAIGLEEPLIQNFLYQPDPTDNIFSYLNSTKPFHSKFRGLIEKKTTADDSSNTSVIDTLDETITMHFDAVSIHPDQELIQSILSLPQITTAEKAYKQQQINSKFTEAERVAVYTNYDPEAVLPGAKYRGLDINGVNFDDLSTLFGMKSGYDSQPYDSILGYDFDPTAPINLYDVYINGKTFNDTDSNEIIIDGDKFHQPYLAENHPDQLVQTRVGDVLNLSIYTQELSGVSGYDTSPYDSGPYDFIAPVASIFLGYRIFENITGQTQITRISDAHSPKLTQALTQYDTEIHVTDATMLSQPDVLNRIPGVIFIGAERIIFWQVTGNVLSQILRGTSGTPWGASYLVNNGTYAIGTTVRDAGKNQEVPLTAYNWLYTPDGLSEDISLFAQFLQSSYGSYGY